MEQYKEDHIIFHEKNNSKQHKTSISFESKDKMDEIKSFIRKQYKNFSKWVRQKALAEIEGNNKLSPEINTGVMARPIIEGNFYVEKYWQVYDVIKDFETEEDTREYANKNGIKLIEEVK